jgi:hypothetical protein
VVKSSSRSRRLLRLLLLAWLLLLGAPSGAPALSRLCSPLCVKSLLLLLLLLLPAASGCRLLLLLLLLCWLLAAWAVLWQA